MGFTTISFEKNQSMAFSDYFWSIIKSSLLFEKVAIVLSLCVFYEIRQVIYKNVEVQQSDPCGTPESIIWNILRTWLKFTDCFWRFRYECKKVRKSTLKPKASILAISKSWGMQSKAFDNSIKNAPTILLLSRFFFWFFIKHGLHCNVFCKLKQSSYYRKQTVICEHLIDFWKYIWGAHWTVIFLILPVFLFINRSD